MKAAKLHWHIITNFCTHKIVDWCFSKIVSFNNIFLISAKNPDETELDEALQNVVSENEVTYYK